VPLNVLFLGLQGSGKGTQGKRLADEYGLAYIGTGDMLRAAVAEGSVLGRRVQPILESGALVPDDLMIELIADRIGHDDALDGFVLDGFPRTYAQAEALDRMLSDLNRDLTVVFELQVPHDVAVERLRLRAADEGRSDDTPDAIERRIALYNTETAPLLEHYRARGRLIGIHGDRSVNEVFREIQDALEQLAVRE
jgi:adenylate kinase